MTAKVVSNELALWALPAPPDKHEKQDSRYIGLLSKEADHACVLLASMGLSYACIAVQTGLSHGQIAYRLKRAGVSAKEYRQGVSDCAQVVIDAAARRVARIVNDRLRKVIEV